MQYALPISNSWSFPFAAMLVEFGAKELPNQMLQSACLFNTFEGQSTGNLVNSYMLPSLPNFSACLVVFLCRLFFKLCEFKKPFQTSVVLLLAWVR